MTPANPTPQPLTMRELIEKATPGPWSVHTKGQLTCVASAPKKNGKRDKVALFPVMREPEWLEVHAQLIARCSPDTLRAVLEALEAAKERAGQHRMSHYYATGGMMPDPDEALQTQLFAALSLLNGHPAPAQQ